jgi:hypothetical protein
VSYIVVPFRISLILCFVFKFCGMSDSVLACCLQPFLPLFSENCLISAFCFATLCSAPLFCIGNSLLNDWFRNCFVIRKWLAESRKCNIR